MTDHELGLDEEPQRRRHRTKQLSYLLCVKVLAETGDRAAQDLWAEVVEEVENGSLQYSAFLRPYVTTASVPFSSAPPRATRSAKSRRRRR